MYKKILVPLDGSELAECVLPHVESITKGCGVETVVFLRVIDTDMPSAIDAYLTEEQRKEADHGTEMAVKKYLNQIVSQVQLGKVDLQTQSISGKVAESIVGYAAENSIDLIVIATHGRSGVSRWVMGSVADRVLRATCIPVLMIRVPGCVPGI